MSGTPFNLRFDVYQEARQNLMDRYYSDHEVWTNWNCTSGECSGECPVGSRPEVPSTEEILVEAEKVYEFVCTK